MSFKLKSTMLLIVLGAMTVLPIIPMGPDGKSMLDNLRPNGGAPALPKFIPNQHDTLTPVGTPSDNRSMSATLTDAVKPGGVYKVYKWKDIQGRTQLTDQPPPEGTAFKVITMNQSAAPKTSTTQTAPAPAQQASALDKTTADASQVSGVMDILKMYSPDKIQQVMDSAKQVNQMAADRQKAMEDAMNQLEKVR